MLHEYAVAPELVATWVDRKKGRYFIDEFGIGTPRIISRYPRKQWKKQVWTAWRAHGRDSQFDRKRMEELLTRLSYAMVERLHAVWQRDRSWVENAVEEHHRIPFHAILPADDAVQHPSVLVADDADGVNPLWSTPHSRIVPRRADRIAGVMRDMLRAAVDIVFIDPYFTPRRPQYVNVIGACVRASRERRAAGDSRIRILGAVRQDGEESEFFEDGCRQFLPPVLPVGQEVTVCRLSERPRGEKLHNRYVLTEHGGVAFGTGLDEGRADTTDDLTLLDRDSYRLRWRQYASDQPAFDRLEGEIAVVGSRRSWKRTQPAGGNSTSRGNA